MKLILFNTLFTIFADKISCQNLQKEQFQFPSYFSTPSSVYLPPSTETPFSYYSMNTLPFQLLPTTWTNRASSTYPTFSPYMSSTWSDKEEESDNGDIEININTKPISTKISQNRINNITENKILDKNDNKLDGKMENQHTPLRRFDIRLSTPIALRSNDITQTSSPSPVSHRMIITNEMQRTDPSPDLMKTSSYENSQYASVQGVFVSSTTEPAIPIIRLSNEMDLDGSFSYEALGADQTHYVQHSRIENMGTDKEEQIVEGSYSYIGDDGHTYTVNYVADSNGFRATGDHLPVSPPIPEIIQRAVQYNLAQEAKKPPHSRSLWEYENETNKELESHHHHHHEGNKGLESNEQNIYIPRNLFTGKTPEAFSYGFSHGSNMPYNIIPGGSFQIPTKATYETSRDQTKFNTNSVPTVTFLASQGAHSPSRVVQPPTKITNSEKSPLPQLMNYEHDIKNKDQDASKALWRWQYGLNANQNQNPKNSISRSSGVEDDVIINFDDMTPEKYTQMMQSHILSESVTSTDNHKYSGGNIDQLFQSSQNVSNNTLDIPEHELGVPIKNINVYHPETESHNPNDDIYDKMYTKEGKFMPNTENFSPYSKIQNFTPQNAMGKKSYNSDNTSFESSKIITNDKNYNDLLPNNYYKKTTLEPLFKTPFHIGIKKENSSLNSMTYNSDTKLKEEVTTTVQTVQEMIKENIFLRNIFKQPHNEEKTTNKPFIEHYKQGNNNEKQIKSEKEPKHIQFRSSNNNIKIINSKPLDFNDIFNYVMIKNNFESIKTKQNNKSVQYLNRNVSVDDKPVQYIPVKGNSKNDIEANNEELQKQGNDYQMINRQQQQELQGNIKNYKVLQRQKDTMQRNQALFNSQSHIKTFHNQGFPPLGRAGPSMKSYLPPTYL